MGGLNIAIPTLTATNSYNSSRTATTLLTDSIKRLNDFSLYDHLATVSESRSSFALLKSAFEEDLFTSIFDHCDPLLQRCMLRNRNALSSWLNALPIQRDHFDLSPQEFRDALCLRYKKPLLELPPLCDGCGAIFTTSHALDCRTGGLVVQRHNEIRDLFCDIASLVWRQVWSEPLIESGQTDANLRADIGIRGAWHPQSMALFDIRVLDSDAPSYRTKSPDQVLRDAERDKKSKYGPTCELQHSSFTPLCMTVDGLVGSETVLFLKRLSDTLSMKWDQSYNLTLNWVRTKLRFALIRATSLCLRGSRSKWRGVSIEDGWGIIQSFH